MTQSEFFCPYREPKCTDMECECAKYKAYQAVSDPEILKAKLNELGLDLNDDGWSLLMKMQKMFAAKFHKVDDLTKTEVDYWVDKYLICIEDEVREVREHLNIYPGEQYHERNNIELRKELIDIIHFMMDEFIVAGADSQIIKQYYLREFAPNILDVKDFLKFAYDHQMPELKKNYSVRENFNTTPDKNRAEEHKILLLANKLLDCGSLVRQQISWKHWKKPSETINTEKLYSAFAHTFKSLMDLFCFLEVKPDDIKSIYIKKNMENVFRQEFNY